MADTGTYALRPGAGAAAGDSYVSTDGPVTSYWDGAAWTDIIPGEGEVTKPVAADWSSYNGSSVPVDLGNGGITTGATQGHVLAAHTSGDTHTFYFRSSAIGLSSPAVGFYQSSSTRGATLYFRNISGQTIQVQRDTVLGVTFNSNVYVSGTNAQWMTAGIWMQVEDDGVDVHYRISSDGKNWQTLYTASRTAFFLTTGPDMVVLAVHVGTYLFSYSKT